MAVALRDYQQSAVNAVREAMRQAHRVLLVSPTGSGKTVMFSHIAELVWARGGGVLLLAHRIEIVLQISAALNRERVHHGIIAPGHISTRWPVQVGMVQTVARRLADLPEPRLLVIDEAHHAVAGAYRQIADAWPDVHTLGVTASPQRLDGRGLGDAFDAMVLGPTVSELIARGYLSSFRYYAPPVTADLSSLRTRAGDYSAAEAAAAMDQARVTGDAEAHYRRYLNGRPAIAFCASVAHAEHVAAAFAARGWKAASVDGAMEPRERARRIAAIGNGGLNVLTSCDVISEGTDIPTVAGAILLRPTQSLVIFLQQCGRVLRPKPEAAVILDHVGNVHRHGLPDAPREWSLTASPRGKSTERPARIRQCESCFAVHSPSPRCPQCGHVYQIAKRAEAPKQADGHLTEVVGSLGWLQKAPLKDVLARCHSREDVDVIRAARKYHPRWVARMVEMHRHRWEREAEAAAQAGQVAA